MARTDGIPQVKAMRARLQLLALLLTVYTLEFIALQNRHSLAFLLGVAALLVVRRVAIAAVLAIGVLLGGQILWLSIGNGPRISRTVIGNQLRIVRLLPLAVSGVFMPKEEAFARTHRVFTGLVWLLPVALAAAVTPVLPGYASLTLWVLTAVMFVLNATTRDSVSGRTIAARVLLKPTAHNDPLFARPDYIRAVRSAAIDVQFGDLDPAESVLSRLRAEPGAELGAALLAAELLAARGDYDRALRVAYPAPDPADDRRCTEARHATDSARAAKLLMLLTEKDPALAKRAVPLAQRHLAALAPNPFAAQVDRTGRILFALEAGDLRVARRLNRICMARARTPLALADALCTQARIDARQVQPEKAVKRLDEAAKLAPWYPRVATVRQLVGADAAAVIPQQLSAAAETDASHVFAEPWSVSGSLPEES